MIITTLVSICILYIFKRLITYFCTAREDNEEKSSKPAAENVKDRRELSEEKSVGMAERGELRDKQEFGEEITQNITDAGSIEEMVEKECEIADAEKKKEIREITLLMDEKIATLTCSSNLKSPNPQS
ncbi:hypothetical protein PFISCL1PPCAC_11893, partial [Pristionchus fissidentatus]